jgi:hypothetical protein
MRNTELRRRLEGAAAGLVYLSEGEAPFAYVEPTEAELHPDGARVEEVSLDRFFAGHIEESDPNDPVAQAHVERFRALKQALRESLEDVRVLRVGEVEIRCFIVGRTASGDLAGLATTAWES